MLRKVNNMEEEKESGRNQYLADNMYAIVFTAHEDGKFAIQFNRPPKLVAGVETTMLLVFGLNRNDMGLKNALRRLSRKFIRFQQKMQNVQKMKLLQEKIDLKKTWEEREKIKTEDLH